MTIHEIFYRRDYFIALRQRTTDNNAEWQMIPCPLNEWYADPFLFEMNGKRWLFIERMSAWRLIGTIAVCEVLENGQTTKFKDVLVEPFHLSFPNVFEYKGQVYMIPESGTNSDIRLYKAAEFPYKWEFVKSLYTGANYVDTSFVTDIKGDSAILNSYDWKKRAQSFFKFDLKELKLSELPENPLMMNERNGGNVYHDGTAAVRVLQDCSHNYGSKIILRQINNTDFEAGKASDSPFDEILPTAIKLNTGHKPLNCHTYNRSEHLEVVDFQLERFLWSGLFFTLRNKIFADFHI